MFVPFLCHQIRSHRLVDLRAPQVRDGWLKERWMATWERWVAKGEVDGYMGEMVG